MSLVQEPSRRRHDLEASLAQAPPRLSELAVDSGVAGVAWAHAKHLKARFPEVVEALDTARKRAWTRHLMTLADLRRVADVLSPIAGSWAVVKGPVLAELVYGAPDRRSYLDLDLLVRPSAFADALHLLEGMGAVLLDRNWHLIASTMRAELSLLLDRRTNIDLHWHLVNEAALRAQIHWDIDALLDRARTEAVGGVTVPVLEPCDALVHLATHACLSGANRMIWFKDIELQLEAFPVPGAAIEDRARSAGVWPQANLALVRSANTLGFPGPEHRTPWTRLNSAVGCGRYRSGHGIGGSGRTLATACRGTATASVRATVAGVMQHVTATADLPAPIRRALPAPPPQHEELKRVAGSERDRARYLGRVVAEGVPHERRPG